MPQIQYLTDGRTIEAASGTTLLVSRGAWEQVSDAARCGRVIELPLKGKSATYPLYEITALAGAGAQQFTN
jgi:hypothetical protein